MNEIERAASLLAEQRNSPRPGGRIIGCAQNRPARGPDDEEICPVCRTPVDREIIDVTLHALAPVETMLGWWRCPNECDPR